MKTYPLAPKSITKEKNIINQILMNNGYYQQAAHPKRKHVTLNNTKKKTGLHSPILAHKLGLL
jgi:hypothetical protein